MIIWPKEVSPTQGKMGRQSVPSTALSLRAMCLLQKRQNYEKWSTSCPDPIPLYIPCHRVPVWQEGGKQGSGLEWSQKELIQLDLNLWSMLWMLKFLRWWNLFCWADKWFFCQVYALVTQEALSLEGNVERTYLLLQYKYKRTPFIWVNMR